MAFLRWSFLGLAAMAAGVMGCSSDEGDDGPTVIGGAGGGTSGAGGTTVGGSGGTTTSGAPCPNAADCTCEGACCPTAAECYANGSPTDATSVGDECMAQRDNSTTGPNPDRVQYRLVWARSTAPEGNTIDVVYNVLSNGASLPWATCNQGIGIGAPSGFIQLMDLNLTGDVIENHTSRVGYAPFVPEANRATAVSSGLCMIQDTFHDMMYALPAAEMSSTEGWPAVMAANFPPMPQPWTVQPTLAKRRATDFNIATDREELLQEVVDRQADGVFFLDEEAGRAHGYSPQAWVVVYSGGFDTRIAIPIREVETTSQVNNPDERSCIGAFRGEALPAGTCIDMVQTNPQWGCYGGTCPGGEAPATAKGYFLITELEQVYSTVLMSTLCVSYPTQAVATADGFAGDWGNFCSGSPSWDPSLPNNEGLPHGDWCSVTNGPATATCHDAFRSETFQAFQAFDIQDATCTFTGM